MKYRDILVGVLFGVLFSVGAFSVSILMTVGANQALCVVHK